MSGPPSRRERQSRASSGSRVLRSGIVVAVCSLLVLGVLVLGVVGGRALLDGVSLPSAVDVLGDAKPSQHADPKPARPTVSSRAGHLAAERVDRAKELLARQAAAVRTRNRAAYLATIDPRTPTFGAASARTFDNLVRMGARSYTFGAPVEDPGALSPARRRVLGPSAWVAEVDVSLVLAGLDREPWKTTLRMVFLDRGGKTYLAADREGLPSTDPTPLWLTDRVNVVHGKHSLLVGVQPPDRLERFARTADRSVPRVTGVWGEDWAQFVVVLVPATQKQMERVVGVDAESQGAVAAVTTSVGRATPRDASHIVVNPDTFDKIGSLGRLVVLTHEITHVAAHATVSTMPVWLSEGFADYVGFHETGLSTSVVAQEFLAGVRRSGPPGDLPDAAQFDPQAKGLDEAYESAWTACRYIADSWGERELVRFYRAMDGVTTAAAENRTYAATLDTTPEEFLAGWRRYVEEKSTGG